MVERVYGEGERNVQMNPKVIKVSNDLPCKKCGKVMMIPRDRGICIPCLSKKSQK